MSEICLCCQSQDVKEDEETTEDPIKKMRTEIDLREASRNFVSAREARSSLIRAVQSCLEITSAISDLTGSKSRLLSESKRNTFDGTLHLHIWITFIRKVDTVNPRYFDATIGNDEEMQRVTYHCNIRREDRRRSGVSNAIRAYEYLCKYDGTVPVDIVGSTRLYPTSRNFRKEYGDRSQWLAYLAVSAMPAPTYPIRLPDGDEADTPLASCKQRHLWIWGPASSGKTLWLEKNIVCFRNYRVAGTMYPFDNYDGEQIIVYDDVIPKAEHLLSICNSSAYPRPCPDRRDTMCGMSQEI